MKFCGQCGARLVADCPHCGFGNPGVNRFCGHCGGALTASAAPGASSRATAAPASTRSAPAASPSSRPVPGAPNADAAERRLLTVLFCDLVGSTELAGELDLDALRQVMARYQSACSEPIERYGGHIAQLLGDGLLVYFGYPHAHEDDAQRAVHAALGVVERIRGLSDELSSTSGTPLGVRVAVHTGPVVAGEMGAGDRREALALGQTPNIAARLQGLVEPGTVGVSEATWRLTRGFFDFEPLGEHTLKGVAGAVSMYRPLRATGVRTRFELTARSGLVSMVGRREELAALVGAFEATCAGGGRVVLVTGEAGIGKSRLVHEFLETTSGRPQARLVGRCSPYHQLSAFYPIIDIVRDAIGISAEEPADAQLETLEAGLHRLDLPLHPNVPLLASFLSIPLGDRYTPLGLIPQKEKERTLEALVAMVLRLSESRPVVIVVEDVHWADPSTLELLGLIARRWRGAPILTVVTTRPDASPPWGLLPHLTVLALERLSDDDAGLLVRSRLGEGDIPRDVLREVIARADGIPLFVEEVAEMLSESAQTGTAGSKGPARGRDAAPRIPTSLVAALTERLDRREEGKELAQLGSVFGREFTHEMIRSVAHLGPDALGRELGELVDANLLTQRGVPPRVTYSFRHALVRDAAYTSMVTATRQRHHRSVAKFLSESLPGALESQPEVVAHHWTEGARPDLALPLWLGAGQRALQRSANVEAVAHLQRGVELLEALPAGPERDGLELGFHTMLGPALSAIRGYAAPEVNEAYGRALELCRSVGRTQGLFWIMRGLSAYYFVAADLARAAEVGSELLALANPADPSEVMDAHYLVGLVQTFEGEFDSGGRHLYQAIALDSPERDRSSIFLTGLDVGVISCCIAIFPTWAMGWPDRALAHAERAIELSKAIRHPLSLACALFHAAEVRVMRRERQEARRLAAETVTLAGELGFFFDQIGDILLGWAEEGLAEGVEKDPLARMEDGLAGFRGSGAGAGQTFHCAHIVEVALGRGDLVLARKYLADWQRAMETTGERFWEADYHRLCAEAALGDPELLDREEEAERAYRTAIEVARRQGAPSFELRAALGLARLRVAGERGAEARALLERALAGIKDGFDTADPRAARELLASLDTAPPAGVR
jgi:class 3 adenylate cyclase